MISSNRQRIRNDDTDPSFPPTKVVVILRLELLPLFDDYDLWVCDQHDPNKTTPPIPANLSLHHLVVEMARQRRQTLELMVVVLRLCTIPTF